MTEVVLMDLVHGLGAIPIQHNSVHSPSHPCRGKVLKVGRKYIHIETIGAPWKALPYADGDDQRVKSEVGFRKRCAVPVDIAKELYSWSMTNAEWRAGRSDEFIAECVKNL